MADASQLLVLISILNGLALARLFERICEYFYRRDRVLMDWLVPGWAGLAFLFVVRNWWAYAKGPLEVLSFWQYLDVLASPLLVYAIAVLLTPEVPAEGKLDLTAHYFKVHRWVFGLLLFYFLKSQIYRVVQAPAELPSLGNLIRLVFIALLVLVTATRRRSVHVAFCVVALVLYLAFALIVR